MPGYVYQLKEWPHFTWDESELSTQLIRVRYKQGKLLGQMAGLGFNLQAEANLQTLTLEVLKTSEIEGVLLEVDQVRSSIARRLGLDIGGVIPVDPSVEGVVEMMLDATQNFESPLTADRMFGWHAALFPIGRSGMQKIVVGQWRDNKTSDPMQVLSGPMGRETIHFRAPDSALLKDEMQHFLNWFNEVQSIDPVIKAAIAHLWFVTIHPFDDGNGRIARALADMQLARSDKSSNRFYSMSAQIRNERNGYYDILESTQKGSLDTTPWLEWFLGCLDRALSASEETLANVLQKARFWEKHAQISFNERQRFMIQKLLNGFVGKLTSSKWAKLNTCSSDTAVRDTNDLVKKEILVKDEGGGRSTSYSLKTT